MDSKFIFPHSLALQAIIFIIGIFTSSAALIAGDDAKCGLAHSFQTILGKGEAALAECQQPAMQEIYISKLGKFAIHYDNIGVHSVNPTDADMNGVPDYVDSAAYYLDYAYKVETGELGYPPAPTPIYGGNAAPYDVFLWNIATVPVPATNTVGVYGVTQICGPALSGGGATTRYKTFIILDNDFSTKDSANKRPVYNTFGIDALKITAAHEYHHAIQIGVYGYAVNNIAPYETTSTWIETRLFPRVYDYVYYLNGFFNDIPEKRFGVGEQSAGYGNVLVYMYLANTYSDSVIRRMWENIAIGTNVFRALDDALIERGTDLNEAWRAFMPWIYYTGRRAKPDEYFADGARYPMLKYAAQENFSEPSFLRTIAINAFELQLLRTIFNKSNPAFSPDTADFLITNPNKEIAFAQNGLWRNMEFVISRENLPNQLPGLPYSWKLSPPELYSAVFFSAGVNTKSLEYAYPSPYRPDEGDALLSFAAPASIPFSDKITLSIYSPSWQNIFSGETYADSDGGKKVIRWSSPNINLVSGTYIYTLSHKGDIVVTGKFSVIRK